jgi:hypothetical protein
MMNPTLTIALAPLESREPPIDPSEASTEVKKE